MRIYTVCDHRYQWFLPTWAHSAKRIWPHTELAIDFVGEMHPTCEDLLAALGVEIGFPGMMVHRDIPPSCLRFLLHSGGSAETMITDVDIMFIDEGVWCYLMAKMRFDGLQSYAAFQGTKKHPVRPAIAPNGWKGLMRRLCGGFVLVTPQWYKDTQRVRDEYTRKFIDGWGQYREADEVLLCRLCDEGVYVTPSEYKFNELHRNLHVGDFRPDMEHRFTNEGKMGRFLPPISVIKSRQMLADKGFQEVLSVVRACGGELVNQTWDNVIQHLKTRKP